MTKLEDLVAKLAEERLRLLGEIEALGPGGWSKRSGDEDWTPRQQLLHLAAVEPQYASAALVAASNPGSSVPGVEQRTPSYADAESWSPESVLEELSRVRAKTLEATAAIREDQLELKANHGSFGELSVAQLLRAIYRHDRMHADQIAGREVTFQPRSVNS